MLLPVGLLSLAGGRAAGRPGGRWRGGVARRVCWWGSPSVGFVFVKAAPAGHDAYAWAVGALRWPLHGGGVVRADQSSRAIWATCSRWSSCPLPFTLIRAPSAQD